MSSTLGTSSASDIQTDYMKLLITQLQNQNPLEPMNNNEMASQLAQFSQLSQLENMNTSFASVLETTERSYANSLIGKEVSFLKETDIGMMEVESGTVEKVINDIDGEVGLLVGQNIVSLEEIVSVQQ